MADSAAINSPDYWNHRFAEDWTARGGAEQTSFFAGLALTMLPDWFWADAIANKLSLVDVGCALGEALPGFRTRLPQSKLTGVDVSKVAIRMARERLPDFTFRAVKPDWSDAPRGDIMFCSNTLEHLKDWKKRLAKLSELSDKYVLMLVPFQEQELIDEHVVSFDFTSFPASLPDGRRLLYFRIIDASQAQKTQWPGHQALAIYGPSVKSTRGAEASHDPFAGADFRGRSVAQIKAALLGLQAAYSQVQSESKPNAQQAAVDRINAEWAQKLDASVAEMNAKHAEMRAYYEGVISERDAKLESAVADLLAKHGELKTHYERLLGERDAKLESSVAELVAKHSELKTHYERLLGERDTRIGQLSEVQALRQRAHELEDALRENLTQQLRRSEEQAAKYAEQAAQARVEAAQIKAEAAQAERAVLQSVALEQEKLRSTLAERSREVDAARSEADAAQAAVQLARIEARDARAQAEQFRADAEAAIANALAQEAAAQAAAQLARTEARDARAQAEQFRADAEAAIAENRQSLAAAAIAEELEAARALLAAREREIEALKADVKRATADHAALKAAITVAVDERDQARANQGGGGATPARVQELEAELAQAQQNAEASQAEVERAKAMASAAAQELQAQHAHAMRDLVAALDPALDALRRAWQGDYARLSGRTALLERHTEELRTQLLRILASKSLKLGTSLRRVYWTARGQPSAPNEEAPSDLPAAPDPGSEFLRLWDKAKRSADAARRVAVAAPVIAAHAPPPPSVQAPPPPPAPPPPVVSPPPPQVAGGRVIALQAASLGSGGLERVVFDLAVGLKARGETVIAICVQSGGVFADDLRQRGITVHEINRDVGAFETVLRENGVTDLFAHHSYFGYERAASLGVRLYDVVHNYYFWHRGSGNMIRRVAELSAGIVYVSAAVRAFHERLFGVPVNKGVVINNPVHIDGLIVPEKPQLQRLREKSAETIFLNVAQAFPSKAQPAMITAFARALRKNRAMKLQIAGGAVKEEAARAVRARIDAEGVGSAVELLGHCDRRKMSRLYAEAHAFVLPSLYEGYSVSAIEAATYGLPLILTNVGGADDLITKSGVGVLLPPATDDLSKLDPPAVERLGLEKENAATAALEQAFLTVARERAEWTARGLAAHYDIRSLDDVIDAYIAVMPAMTRASA